MARLETGTSITLPAGTKIQIAGEISLRDIELTSSVPGVLVNQEEVMGSVTENVLLPRGAYVRLSVDVALDEGSLPAGTTVFVLAGSYMRIVAKATDLPMLPGERSCDFPWFLLLLGSVLSIVLGGLALSAIKGKD